MKTFFAVLTLHYLIWCFTVLFAKPTLKPGSEFILVSPSNIKNTAKSIPCEGLKVLNPSELLLFPSFRTLAKCWSNRCRNSWDFIFISAVPVQNTGFITRKQRVTTSGNIFHLVEPGATLEARNSTIILTRNLNYTNCDNFVGNRAKVIRQLNY